MNDSTRTSRYFTVAAGLLLPALALTGCLLILCIMVEDFRRNSPHDRRTRTLPPAKEETNLYTTSTNLVLNHERDVVLTVYGMQVRVSPFNEKDGGNSFFVPSYVRPARSEDVLVHLHTADDRKWRAVWEEMKP